MAKKEYPFIVLETLPQYVCYGTKYSKVNGFRILDTIFDLSTEYKIPVIFAGSRVGAEYTILSILKICHKKLCKKFKKI